MQILAQVKVDRYNRFAEERDWWGTNDSKGRKDRFAAERKEGVSLSHFLSVLLSPNLVRSFAERSDFSISHCCLLRSRFSTSYLTTRGNNSKQFLSFKLFSHLKCRQLMSIKRRLIHYSLLINFPFKNIITHRTLCRVINKRADQSWKAGVSLSIML